MANPKDRLGRRLVVALSFVFMLIMNAAANAVPINGLTTGEVSDSFPNLFAPIGWTFSIWGLIYLLLGLHLAYQLGWIYNKSSGANKAIMARAGFALVLTSFVNGTWIVAWHYLATAVSLGLMVALLLLLGAFVVYISPRYLTLREYWLVRVPFSIYFAWICVATIANTTILLVSREWGGFGLAPSIWTSLILVVGLLIGAVTTWRLGDIAFGGVFVWAYAGILAKHISPLHFAWDYPLIVGTAALAIVGFVVTMFMVWRRPREA